MTEATADGEDLNDDRALGGVCNSAVTALCRSFSDSNKGAMIKDQNAPANAIASGAAAMFRIFFLFVTWFVLAGVDAAEYPAPAQGDFVVRNFRFASGEKLPELRLHYRTLGMPQRDAQGVVRNAVLILHGTGGSGAQFIRPEFAGALFGDGQLLDARRYFIILPDGIGHGQSSKPSDGLHAAFPRYGYIDMVEAQYRLVTDGLGVNHLRLVMGTSMGGMHSWLWGERYPGFMDALMPLASLPTQISGRNRVWRRVIIDAIRADPDWRGGDYASQPPSLRTASEMLHFMSSNPPLRQQQMPTLAKSDAALDSAVESLMKTSDANDTLYQFEASRDYDPGPDLEKIRAPLMAVNSADDLINPPELGILEREIKRVPNGKAIILPLSPETRGHGTHTVAAVWKQYLEELLSSSSRPY
jgi:homoserine O-acetyltransferase/O-succinyltransferase